jgi:hypothetical protein
MTLQAWDLAPGCAMAASVRLGHAEDAGTVVKLGATTTVIRSSSADRAEAAIGAEEERRSGGRRSRRLGARHASKLHLVRRHGMSLLGHKRSLVRQTERNFKS